MSVQKVHRILVVDDESDVTELLEYKLEQEGYLSLIHISEPTRPY